MVKTIPDGFHSITPYVNIEDAQGALKFYESVFGATIENQVMMPDGRVGHAELRIGDSLFMIASEFPEMGYVSPTTLGGTHFLLHLYVDDVDNVFAQAIENGATELEPIKDKFHGDRSGTIEDPFGYRWIISTHIKDVSPEEMQHHVDNNPLS